MPRVFLHMEGDPDGTITRASLCGSRESVIISLVAFAASCPDFEAMLVAAAHYVEEQPAQFAELRRDLDGSFCRTEKMWVEPVVIRSGNSKKPPSPNPAAVVIRGEYAPTKAQQN